MMKTFRKLKEKQKIFESEFFVFDTETTPFELNKVCKLIFGVVYGLDYKQVLYTENEYKAEFLKPMYKNKKVFAHNAEFDLNVIYGNIYEFDQKAIFNGKFICATNGNCTFADSMNIFPTSVKEIGKLIGLKKLELSKEFWSLSEVTGDDIIYCTRDCEIIFNALAKMFELAGNIKITVAGLSLDFFRRKYQSKNIDYNNELSLKFFNSYYGGRCEAFKLGKCDAVVYDINSMYPFAMVNAKFPNPKYLKRKTNISYENFRNRYLENYEGVIFCTVNHLQTYIGYLPYRLDGKLLFPVGNFTGWWNFNEIRYGIESGIIEIDGINEIIYSEPIDSPFAEYANECYRLRFETTSEFNSYLYKLFANSLYGKFAQKIQYDEIYIQDMELQYKEITAYKDKGLLIEICTFNEYRKDCFLKIKSNETKYMANTIPLFSSYITSFARVQLLTLLKKYENYEPIYCDTDSIFFNIDPDIKSSKKLGEFKKEKKIIKCINGLKNYDYICENKANRKIKGIPKTAIEQDKKFTYFNLVKTREALRRNIKAGTQIERSKVIKHVYDKRTVYSNGETKAIHLYNDN